MAISPKSLEERFQEDAAQFDAKFDNLLSTRKIAKGQSIELNIPNGYTRDHHNILEQRYINVGWSKFEWCYDRETNWLSLTY